MSYSPPSKYNGGSSLYRVSPTLPAPPPPPRECHKYSRNKTGCLICRARKIKVCLLICIRYIVSLSLLVV
ncbi:hypothetical protein K474DRAFT_451836 [Panus rudis PR-1116 ss-1]|nr:hypothetical protein K474DRAFT_451836 [Panus rudis PR-1116 ss-1]